MQLKSLRLFEPLGLFCLFILAILFSFYFPWLINARSFYLSDLTYYFEPFLAFISKAMQQGRLPLWNPFNYCGMPQIAIPSPGIFYLPNFLFVFLPFSQALAFFMILHQLLAGAGAFCLVCRLGWGTFAALTAGVVCALSGYMFALTSNFTLIATAAWLPLCTFLILQIEPWFNRRNILFIGLTAFTLAMFVAAGRPEIWVLGLLLIIITIAITFCVSYSASNLVRMLAVRRFCWQLLTLILGLALSALILVPTLEWIGMSPRAHGLKPVYVFQWSANWYDFLCLIFSQPLGDLTVLGSPYLPLVASRSQAIPYLTSAYVGPLAFTLALWSLPDRTWRTRWWVLLVLIGSSAMCLGSNSLLAPTLIHYLPYLAFFRYPVKLMIVPVFCLAVLAARGAYLAQNQKVSTVGSYLASLIWGISLLAGLSLLSFPQLSIHAKLWFTNSKNNVNQTVWQNAQHMFGEAIVWGACIGICFSFLNYVFSCRKMSFKYFSSITIIMLTCTLLLSAYNHSRHATAIDFFKRPNPLAIKTRALLDLHDDTNTYLGRILPLYFDPLICLSDFVSKQQLPYQEAFYQLARQLLLPNINMEYGVPSAFGYEATEIACYKEVFREVLKKSHAKSQHLANDLPLARFCKITAVHYVLTQAYPAHTSHPVSSQKPSSEKLAYLDPTVFKLLSEDNTTNVRIYRCLDSLPRIYFASAINWVNDWQTFHEKLLQVHQPVTVSNTHIKSRNTVPLWFANHTSFNNVSSDHIPGNIKIVADTGDYLRLEVQTAKPSFLVLADQYYPGWQAYIDTKVVPIYQANLFNRAVLVLPGQHSIEFAYKPISFLIGIALTITAGLALLIMYFAASSGKSKSFNYRHTAVMDLPLCCASNDQTK